MPLYEFVCRDCNRQQELLVRGSETPVCTECGGQHLSKLLSLPVTHTAGGGQTDSRPRPSGSCGSGCGCHPH
jgi:putative FmdB family regulatory protein